MEYYGHVYGKVNGKYVKLMHNSESIKALENELSARNKMYKELEKTAIEDCNMKDEYRYKLSGLRKKISKLCDEGHVEQHRQLVLIEDQSNVISKLRYQLEGFKRHYNWCGENITDLKKQIESMKNCFNCDRIESPYRKCMMDCSRQEATDSTTDLWELKENK